MVNVDSAFLQQTTAIDYLKHVQKQHSVFFRNKFSY